MHDTPLRSRPRWLAVTLLSVLAVGGAGCGGGDKPKKKETAATKSKSSDASTGTSTGASSDATPGGVGGSDPSPAGTGQIPAKLLATITAIENGDAPARTKAIRALLDARDQIAAAKSTPAESKLAAVLSDAISDRHWEARSLACIALLELQGRDAAVFAGRLLKDEDENVRTMIANELGRLGKDYADELVEALDDESADLREVVLDHLTQMGAKNAAPRVVALLRKTDSERVQAQALAFLLKTGSPTGIGAVVDLIDDLSNPQAVSRAVAYVGKHGTDKQVKEDVVRFIPDDHILVRKAAVEAVVKRKCRTGDAIASLINLLGHEDQEVRTLGHEALGTLTGQKFGFDPANDAEANADSMKKWRVWLRENESKLRG